MSPLRIILILNEFKKIYSEFSQEMLDDFSMSVPSHLSAMKESYKTMRKSESDLFET